MEMPAKVKAELKTLFYQGKRQHAEKLLEIFRANYSKSYSIVLNSQH